MPEQPPTDPAAGGPEEPGRHHAPDGRRIPPGYQFIDELNASARQRSTRRGRAAAALRTRGALIALAVLLLAGAGIGTGLTLTGGGSRSTAGGREPGRGLWSGLSSHAASSQAGGTAHRPAGTHPAKRYSSRAGGPSEHHVQRTHPPSRHHVQRTHAPARHTSPATHARSHRPGRSAHKTHPAQPPAGHPATSAPAYSSRSTAGRSHETGAPPPASRPAGGTQQTGPAVPAKPGVQQAARTVPAISLNVLNNTTTTGLAARAAQEFHARGWIIGTVGNFTGTIPRTTVYYDRGNSPQERAAYELQRQFPGILRVLPHYDGLPISGLTVVLAPDWN